MCCGAMVWVKLGRLVYAASDIELCEILGVPGSECCKTVFEAMGSSIDYSCGLMREEALEVLREYFAQHEKG
jgi:tRNA(Arg) A34 adenosine deaminase TadA